MTSLGFQATQWSVKQGVFDDFWHYCDELEARLDTVVVERPVGLIWHGNDRMHHSVGPCLVVGNAISQLKVPCSVGLQCRKTFAVWGTI